MKHGSRWAKDVPVTLIRKCLHFTWGISVEATSEHLWSFSAPVAAVLSNSRALACFAPTCLLASRQVSSLTSLAVRHPVLCLLGCQIFRLTSDRLFFFFLNSCFQLSNDSDTAARVKRSSSLSELYGRRLWVSFLKESLLGPATSFSM